jgi:hypothetical protein
MRNCLAIHGRQKKPTAKRAIEIHSNHKRLYGNTSWKVGKGDLGKATDLPEERIQSLPQCMLSADNSKSSHPRCVLLLSESRWASAPGLSSDLRAHRVF